MKMKKCLAIILALVMALGCMSITAFAADDECEVCEGKGSTTNPGAVDLFHKVETIINDLLDFLEEYDFTEENDSDNKYNIGKYLNDTSLVIKEEMKEYYDIVLDYDDSIYVSCVNLDNYISLMVTYIGMNLSFTAEIEEYISEQIPILKSKFDAFEEVVSVFFCPDCGGTGKITAPDPDDDPSGVDLSMLTTGAKIQLGTQDESPVEWVIGGDGETGMSVPTGCIALVTSDLVASVKFNEDEDDGNAYATSILRTVVEGAVTFTDDEQAAIKSRTLAGNQTYGTDCDGVAGDSVTATVWAPTTKDARDLVAAGLEWLSRMPSEYWVCSPGSNEGKAAYVNVYGNVYERYLWEFLGVRAALYLDTSKITNVTLVKGTTDTYILNAPETTFLTTFTLNKDYNDKYSTGDKTTAVSETVSFTITPISTGDDVPEFTSSTFTIDVTDGVGEAEVDLPDLTDVSKVGEYWYKIEETAGTTAGVTYDNTTYYLHLIVSYKNGEFGFSSAAIRSSNEVTATDGVYPATGKIDTVSNSYGEGTLTVAQTTTVNGEASDEDAFEVTVTFTAPAGTTVIGDITYGDETIEPGDWNDDGTVSVEIELKGGETVTFENIPDGVTYTVEQTEKNEDKGYTLDEVAFDVTDETGDSVSDANVASGTIGDTADTVTFTNSKSVPIDVGVILENGAFIVLALGALIAAAWLIVSKRRKSVDAE